MAILSLAPSANFSATAQSRQIGLRISTLQFSETRCHGRSCRRVGIALAPATQNIALAVRNTFRALTRPDVPREPRAKKMRPCESGNQRKRTQFTMDRASLSRPRYSSNAQVVLPNVLLSREPRCVSCHSSAQRARADAAVRSFLRVGQGLLPSGVSPRPYLVRPKCTRLRPH